MASIKAHTDSENIVPENRLPQKQPHLVMAAQQKRSALGVIDNKNVNRQTIKTKQPLKETTNNANENIRNKENRKKVVVPVAQFEAFTVYEDDEQKSHNQKQRLAAKKNNKDDIPPVINDSDENSTETAQTQPMSVEKYDENQPPQLAVDIIKETSGKDALFFEMLEYRDDIFTYLREHELRHRPKPGYIVKQPDVTISMRAILVDWLVEVVEEYKMQTETLYLAVNFIDRFLSYMSVVRAKLQLVGTAAMFIASKYEEIFPPDVSEFVYITDDTYDKHQVIRMEHLILRVLGFDISIPTPLTFLKAISVSAKLTQKTLYLAMYFSELALLEVEPYLQFLPSMIASSAIALARHTLAEDLWTDKLVETTGYSLKDLEKCVCFLQDVHSKAADNPQHAIQDKYKAPKFYHVANLSLNNDMIVFN